MLPAPERDENIMAARFLNLLAAYTGKPAYRDAADHAMRYLVAPQVAQERFPRAVCCWPIWKRPALRCI
jgi:hypothetical protein